MRASADTASVAGCSATELTLPRIMPSTRNPPLKITLPSMRVVAPMRLSIRFCGLLFLLNIVRSVQSLQRYRLGCARLLRARLVDAHLDALHLRLRVDPESAFDPPEVLESQLESGCPGVRLLGEAHHNIAPPFLEADDELEAPVGIGLAPCAGGHEQQAIAEFARQNVRLDLEAVDGESVAAASLGGQHALECG